MHLKLKKTLKNEVIIARARRVYGRRIDYVRKFLCGNKRIANEFLKRGWWHGHFILKT
jgi:hypothetical protein